jgi:hypothetical protein
MLQQQCSHTALVHSVRHDQPDLGDSPVAGRLVTRHAHQFAGHPRADGRVVGYAWATNTVGDLFADATVEAEKA